MKVLIVGTGGVGESMAQIVKRRDPNSGWLEKMVMADYDLAKAQKVAAALGDDKRFPAEKVNAADPENVAALAKKHDVDIICNMVAPEFNPMLLQAALKAQTHYMDTAMTVSEPHPERRDRPLRRQARRQGVPAQRRLREDRQDRLRRLRRRARHGRLVRALRRRPHVRRDR